MGQDHDSHARTGRRPDHVETQLEIIARLTAQLNARNDEIRTRRTNRILEQFPETGPFRRELYPKHMEFFAAGATEMERCFLAGNRVGKTRAGACEATYHLTGKYPDWWVGKRFDRPTEVWAAGSTNQTVRDIVQAELLGKLSPDKDSRPEDPIGLGTGMIPLDLIRAHRKRQGGVADSIETAYIRHVSGGTSLLGFKTYDQGRRSFEGTGKHFIWVDEECPFDVYIECLTRCMTTKGAIAVTFTPLRGSSELVLHFLPALKLD
jgi:phage terminase large subunit-like protein